MGRSPHPGYLLNCRSWTLRPQVSDFRQAYCRSEIHQKSDLSNIFPKSEKSDLGSQNHDFWLILEPFWCQLSIQFWIFFEKCRKHDSIVKQTISEGFSTSKASIFRSSFDPNFKLFLAPLAGCIFSSFHTSWSQDDGFWEPLGAQLAPKWQPKSSKWLPRAGSTRLCTLFPRGPRIHLFLRSFLERPWQYFGWIVHAFQPYFWYISDAFFADRQSLLARNKLTENINNKQITAKIYKS